MKKLDWATLDYDNELNEEINVLAQSSWCYKCSFNEVAKIPALKNSSFHVNATHATNLIFYSPNTNPYESHCKISDFPFLEYGVYKIKFDSSNYSSVPNKCHIETFIKPFNPNIAPFLLFSMFIFYLATVFFKNFLTKKSRNVIDEAIIPSTCTTENNSLLQENSEEVQITLNDQIPGNSEPSVFFIHQNGYQHDMINPDSHLPTKRLNFLDVFRGFSVVAMIFVNYGGGKYWYFKHAPWNGLTFADTVFPFFIFVMGFSAMISLWKKYQKCRQFTPFIVPIVKRSFTLFIIGFILSNKDAQDFYTFRIMGVLQRIAIVYTLLCFIILAPRYIHRYYPNIRVMKFYLSTWIELALVTLLFCVHQLVLRYAVAPGCPRGYQGPGGLDMNSSYVNCVGGITGYVDRLILKPRHMYNHPTFKDLYQTYLPFDPEGIMGTLSATFLAYIGSFSAKIFLIKGSNSNKNIGVVWKSWIFMAIILGIITGVLTGWSKENGIIPINKNLWSLSYNTGMASISLFSLAVLMLVIEIYNLWDGKPFIFVGKNPLLIYVGHEIFREYFPFNLRLSKHYPILNCHKWYLFQDIWATSLWILLAWILHKKRIFVSI